MTDPTPDPTPARRAYRADAPMACPHCGVPLDGHAERAGETDLRPPTSGDFTVCVYCRGLAVYAALPGVPFGVLTLRLPHPAERAQFLRDYPAAAAGELDATRRDLDAAGIRRAHEERP